MDGVLPLAEGVTSLRIELGDGGLEIRSGADRAIRYGASILRGADTAEQLAQLEACGTALTLTPDPDRAGGAVLRGPSRPPGPTAGVFAVEAHLEIPPAIALDIRIAGSGGIDIEDRAAATSMRTNRGDLRLMRCVGDSVMRTEFGNTIVYEHSGDIAVECGVGDMQVFVRRPGKRIRLITGAGNVQCLVPPETGFVVDCRTQTGKLANGFGLPIEHPSAYSAAMSGQRGDGRTEIVMRTGTGHLSLSHKTFD